MTPKPIHMLTDTGEHDSLDDLSSDALKVLAATPASELSVRMSHRNCWATRWIMSFRIWLAVGLGIALATQILGVIIVRLWLADVDSRTSRTVRDTMDSVLKAHGLTKEASPGIRDFLAQDHQPERNTP